MLSIFKNKIMKKKLINNNFCDVIGNTPLIKLRKASEITGCQILGKCEFLNPGGSVKDRAANQIISDALEEGKISEGGVIVEGTAGNTGIGLTLVANSMNIKTIIVMPETQSDEKKKMLRLCGADLRLVRAVPYKDPNNYVKYSEKISNEKKPEIHIGLADPHGSALYNYFKNGKLFSEGSSITEGIGQGRITKNLEGLSIDSTFRISDAYALDTVFHILKHEGIILGGSSGINIAGAIELGKRLGPGKKIVTILCDYGTRYESKIYNREFLKKNNLPTPDWL